MVKTGDGLRVVKKGKDLRGKCKGWVKGEGVRVGKKGKA